MVFCHSSTKQTGQEVTILSRVDRKGCFEKELKEIRNPAKHRVSPVEGVTITCNLSVYGIFKATMRQRGRFGREAAERNPVRLVRDWRIRYKTVILSEFGCHCDIF